MKGRQNVAYHKFRVLECIKGSKQGLGVSEIEQATRLHRTTVSRLCKSLAKEGFIRRRNKQAPYQLTDKARGDPAIIAFSLGTEGWQRIRKWVAASLASKTEYQKLFPVPGDSKHGKFRSRKRISEHLLRLIISEFATFVGALIVYHILCALSPGKIRLRARGVDTEAEIERSDDVLFRWLDNAIKPGLIFHEFSMLPLVESIFLPYEGGNSSAYEMIEERFEKLIIVFKKLYPKIYSEMEKYRKSLPDSVNSYRHGGGKGLSMGILR